MRSIKELLEILLQQGDELGEGLCLRASWINGMGRINDDEYSLLRKYIKSNRPYLFSSLDVFKQYINASHYYWPEGESEPRIKWIKKHIEKNG